MTTGTIWIGIVGYWHGVRHELDGILGIGMGSERGWVGYDRSGGFPRSLYFCSESVSLFIMGGEITPSIP